MIVDLLFMSATLLFVFADFRQLFKLHKVKRVVSLSFAHFHCKLIAISMMIIGYVLSSLYLSIIVSTVNLILALVTLALMYKYKKEDDEWNDMRNRK